MSVNRIGSRVVDERAQQALARRQVPDPRGRLGVDADVTNSLQAAAGGVMTPSAP